MENYFIAFDALQAISTKINTYKDINDIIATFCTKYCTISDSQIEQANNLEEEQEFINNVPFSIENIWKIFEISHYANQIFQMQLLDPYPT